jgi:hypothetical protein
MQRIVTLEDQGQYFTRLYVNEKNVITDAKPCQGWVWKNCIILQKRIRRGMRLRLMKRGYIEPLTLRYRIVSVRSES